MKELSIFVDESGDFGEYSINELKEIEKDGAFTYNLPEDINKIYKPKEYKVEEKIE